MNYDRKEVIKDEIIHTMKYCGSDAGERKEPGSKLETQAELIVDFLEQLEEFDKFVRTSNLNLLSMQATGHSKNQSK